MSNNINPTTSSLLPPKAQMSIPESILTGIAISGALVIEGAASIVNWFRCKSHPKAPIPILRTSLPSAHSLPAQKTLPASVVSKAVKSSLPAPLVQVKLDRIHNMSVKEEDPILPSGYHALGDIPKQLGWKALTQEELDKMASLGTSLSAVDDAFDNTVEIVEDTLPSPAPHQIQKSEAALYNQLFSHIKLGHTPIKVEGSESFKQEIFSLLKKIISRPSGRWLLLFLCRQENPLLIVPNNDNKFDPDKSPPILGVDFSYRTIAVSRNAEGKFWYPISQDSTLFHEMIHALHFFQNKESTEALVSTPSSDPEYHNLEEQYTIAGIDDKSPLQSLYVLTENMYNFERGFFRRFGHRGDKVSPLFLQKMFKDFCS